LWATCVLPTSLLQALVLRTAGVLCHQHYVIRTGNDTKLKPLLRQSGVLKAFPRRLKNAERRGARCANVSNAVQTLHGNVVQSPRTPCSGVYFEHVQNKRRGLAFPQRVRQHAVTTLWGLLERRGRVVSAPRARCKDAV